MNATQSGYQIDVSRGPNWLFLRLSPGKSPNEQQLGSDLWDIVSNHFVYRVVLEFSGEFKSLSPKLIAQLDRFRSQLELHDGALRVCGLDKRCAERLSAHCAESKIRSRLTNHSSLACAVFGTEETTPAAEDVTQDNACEALRAH